MKKIFSIVSIAIVLVVLPSAVLAQGKQQGQTGAQQQNGIQDLTGQGNATEPQGNQIQNQVETQNAGEDSQLKVSTQESFQASGSSSGLQAGNSTVKQEMSIVDEKVEQLLGENQLQPGQKVSQDQRGIGQEMKIIAQQQKQAQVEIKSQLDQLESRQGLMRKLFGADQKTVKNLRQQLEQNQLRIQQLQQLQINVSNQAEETQIQELTQALLEQNTSLEEQLQAEEQTGSIFGWLIKLFS